MNSKHKTILIPRPLGHSTDKLCDQLRGLGFAITKEPLISIPLWKYPNYLPDFAAYDEIVCVSSAAVEGLMKNIKKHEGVEDLAGLPVMWTPGEATAQLLLSKKCDSYPIQSTGSEAIFKAWLKKYGKPAQLNNKKILIVCGSGGGKILGDLFLEHNITPLPESYEVYEVDPFHTNEPSIWEKLLEDIGGSWSYVWITSGSILEVFCRNFVEQNLLSYISNINVVLGSSRLYSMAAELIPAALRIQHKIQLTKLTEPTNEALLDYLTDRVRNGTGPTQLAAHNSQ